LNELSLGTKERRQKVEEADLSFRSVLRHPETSFGPLFLAGLVCKLCGLYGRGWRNTHTILLRELWWPVPDLPAGLSGLRILFLSDLHLGGPSLVRDVLLEVLPGAEADVTILGGDYRWQSFGQDEEAYRELAGLVDALRRPLGLYAILGNHDEPTFAGKLAELGFTVLLNEAACIEREGARLWLVGVEDPQHWVRHDLDRALKEVPPGEFKLLICHTLDLVREAEKKGIQLYLAGHTHGGQIVLPGGIAPITHTAWPERRFFRGFWQYRRLRGYTTSGAGVSGLPLRFGSRGEVVVLELTPLGGHCGA